MFSNRSLLLRRVKTASAAAMLLGVSACAQNFNANVSRFQTQLPAPAGQTFAVVADDPQLAGGLEFSQYARLVEAQMAKLGYTQATSPEAANLLVRFDYGIDKGRERLVSSPRAGFYDPYWGSWHGYSGFGYAGYGGFGRGGYYGRSRYGSMWGYGWYDPWFDNDVESYTVYTSGIDMKIDRKVDGVRLFEGKAEAASTSNRLPYLVPNLVEAMFTDFPGRSGETVRISIAPEKRTKGS